ncbi:MAG: LD-carboxypeptidase [Chitinophagales bacterium]|nr:LD-carboxypeptidase [Bacteroidota bacterium]
MLPQLPPFLQANDTVALAATARSIDSATLAQCQATLQLWGYKVVLAENISLQHHQFAGTENERSRAFQKLLDDDNIKAIFCVRGGYGSLQIIDQLQWKHFRQKPKWIIGFSDATVLLAHIEARTHTASIHAPMCSTFAKTTANCMLHLEKLLRGKNETISPEPHALNREGEVTATLTGGNLSVLYSMLGSKSLPSWKRKILFLEDLDEYLYHIDRLMLALKRSGRLKDLAGLLVGSFSDMRDHAIPFGENAYHIIQKHTQTYNYPIAFNFPAGHEANNFPLIMGGEYRLSVQAQEVKLHFST